MADEKTTAVSSGMWGGIALAASNIFTTATTTLNPKVRENQLAIAEANARASEANAQVQAPSGISNTTIIIVAVVVIGLIIFLLKSNKA